MRAPLCPGALLCAALLACAGAPATRGLVPVEPPPGEREVELFVARRLADARAFREQGRLGAAERSLRRALDVAPHDAAVHRLLARVLEAQGRAGESRLHWARADALDPPPPPPPDTPLPVDSEGVVVLLVDGVDGADGDGAVAAPERDERRPDPARVEEVLRGRLGARLPWARVVRAAPESVAAARTRLRTLGARAVLSLRAERGFCGYSRKDGEFGVAWLRVAAASRQGPGGAAAVEPHTVRVVVDEPPRGEELCVRLALTRALEEVLADEAVRRALAAAGDGEAWSAASLRALFPGLGRRVTRHVERGRAALATGRVADAAEAFRAALAVDPEAPDARAYLREAEETLAIARALGEREEGQRPGTLEFSLTSAEREAAERLLAEERRRRDELLAALVITEVDERPPPPEAVAALRPVSLPPPDAPGRRLARERAGGPVEARALFGPDGTVVTVYYFAAGGERPLLREEDVDGDGRPDTWIGYRGERRSDLWEDRRGGGAPDVHVAYAGDGRVERIEVDDDADRSPERVFRYADGVLASEARDTDGDDTLDRFETFDAAGRVLVREEDLNGDGRIDVRARYRDGRLVSREIEDPAVMEALLGP